MMQKYSIKDVSHYKESFDYRTPMKFGGRIVEHVWVYHVDLTIEDEQGKSATGHGSMTMGNIWAWPSQVVSSEDTLQAMISMADKTCELAREFPNFEHPIPLLFEFEHKLKQLSCNAFDDLKETDPAIEPMPQLAKMVAASPLDAAIHDAFGKLHNRSSFQTLGKEFLKQDLSTFLDNEFSGRYLSEFVNEKPRANLPLYHLVGALDPIFGEWGKTLSGHDFPELLGDWIVRDGLTHLKIKLAGDDFDWDVERVLDIDSAAKTVQLDRGCVDWCYSLDFNEKCASIDYVVEFLEVIRRRNPDGFDRIQYIEQPTHRDLKQHPQNTVHEAAKIKPVVIDESLIDYETLLLAKEQGYSGVALKACKGQTGSLLMAAAAQKFDMFLCVQDLTCIGHNFLHSASLAAHIPTVAAIEGNGRQYCPEGNKDWEGRYRDVLYPKDGRIASQRLDGVGLGF
ncbi:mandelate racemase/muconate lactonizing enzyme family protein [Pirellulaceae bacterium]|nr:mandelate racemase/muconate lactonizing enzyme family protein [Pirellulaceae bacterium]